MLNMQIFGEKLREHRRTRGLTQEEVAAKIGVSAQAISKWENCVSLSISNTMVTL